MSRAEADKFIIADFAPAYLDRSVRVGLRDRVQKALARLELCCSCPRECNINRLADETKVCRTGRHAHVASAGPHFGEESCLTGWRGSGTIFFASCNLHCVFCQNWDISQQPNGRTVDAGELSDLMLQLQEQGCHNINLVTPEHVVPQMVEALELAIDGGLRVPVVYNTSAYDAVESLKLLDGLIDIYMPDFKYFTSEPAARYSKAKDYPERTREAIREMHRQVGDLRLTPQDLACRGLLVRHLVMPGLQAESAAIFEWLAQEISPDTFVNIMAQYRPAYLVGHPTAEGAAQYEEINRRPTAEELEAAYEAARRAGLWRFDKCRT